VDAVKAIPELGIGEALVSLLDKQGQPTIVQRALIAPPRSQIGPITPDQRQALMRDSLVAGVYDQVVDRESAYEKLTNAAVKTTEDQERMQAASAAPPAGPVGPSILEQVVDGVVGGLSGQRTHRSDTVIEAFAKSIVRSMGTTAGREIARGIMGSIFGGMKR
jgi:DNA helicase HerA-like ATPase